MPIASNSKSTSLRATLKAADRRAPLILDGATGTQLEARGVPTPPPLWSAAALDSHADVVATIHADYVRCGAQILVANTFRTNPRALRRAGRTSDGSRLNRRAMELAANAAADAPHDVWIAASVAPVEDCYRPDLTPDETMLLREHAEMMRWLRDAGANLLWIETIGTQREASAAGRAAREAGFDFALSFVTREDGRLLGGDSLEETVRAISPLDPLSIGVNCVPPAAIADVISRLRDCSDRPLCAYGHVSSGRPIPGWSYTSDVAPPEYADMAQSWLSRGAAIIGGCCGTTPRHIRAAADRLKQIGTATH